MQKRIFHNETRDAIAYVLSMGSIRLKFQLYNNVYINLRIK